MNKLEELIWEQASQVLFISKEEYLEHLRGYELEPFEKDGELLMIVMRKEAELHVVTFKAGAITKRMVRGAFTPQLEKYGYLTTRTPKVDARQHRFNRAMGFVAVGEDQYNVHYRLDRGRSAIHRSSTCQLPPS